MSRPRRLYSRRPIRFSTILHCVELLEPRLLFAAGGLPDPEFPQVTAAWGVAAIQAPEVWAQGYTGRGVTVAVVDSGISLTHADLADRLWSNTDELPDNGRDDDGNGFVDDTIGWDFVAADNLPEDPNGHGTHIAGTIAGGVAAPDDLSPPGGAGEAFGVAPDTTLMPVRVLDTAIRGENRQIAAGIRYAVDNGADIINLSIGGQQSAVLLSALEYARDRDVLVVAATGNGGAEAPSYPAAYSVTLENLLSVGAYRQNGDRLNFSNRVGTSGATQVDAPGQNIRSAFVTAPYGYQSGTSMAAPHVSGLAALALSANPGLSAAELRGLIVAAVDEPANGSDSAGRANASRAIALALAMPAPAAAPASNRIPTASRSIFAGRPEDGSSLETPPPIEQEASPNVPRTFTAPTRHSNVAIKWPRGATYDTTAFEPTHFPTQATLADLPDMTRLQRIWLRDRALRDAALLAWQYAPAEWDPAGHAKAAGTDASWYEFEWSYALRRNRT